MVWNPFRRSRARELEALDRWRTARKLASSDVTDLGEQLAGLPDSVGFEATEHHRLALENYERARDAVRSSTTAEEVFSVEKLLADAHYHRVALLALHAGESVPQPREPCFFDPRHGPSMRDASWSPPVGASRTVPVCASDADRLSAGAEPLTRVVRVGDRYVPVHEVGGYQGVLDHDRDLFDDRQASYENSKYQAQTELWNPGTRFGAGSGGGDGIGGSNNNSGSFG